jgi:hypothetical protein
LRGLDLAEDYQRDGQGKKAAQMRRAHHDYVNGMPIEGLVVVLEKASAQAALAGGSASTE